MDKRNWRQGISPGLAGAVVGLLTAVVLWGSGDSAPAFAWALLALGALVGAAAALALTLLPEAPTHPPRPWWTSARTVLLATALGALAGVLAGAEEYSQRPLVMSLAAGLGLLTGLLLLLVPKADER